MKTRTTEHSRKLDERLSVLRKQSFLKNPISRRGFRGCFVRSTKSPQDPIRIFLPFGAIMFSIATDCDQKLRAGTFAFSGEKCSQSVFRFRARKEILVEGE